MTDAHPTNGFEPGAALEATRRLEERHKIMGEDRRLPRARASDTDEFDAIIGSQINPIEKVTQVLTTIVLRSIDERPPLARYSIELSSGRTSS